MLRTLRNLTLSASAIILAACATATPYQPASAPGGFDGFSQTMIEDDRAKITFGGNTLTERSTVENYLLYRAAEMTIERGFDHFTLVEKETEEKKRVSMSPAYGYGPYDPFFDYSFYRPRFGWSPYNRYSSFYNPWRRNRGLAGPGFNGYSRSGFGFGNDPFFNHYDMREHTNYRATAEVRFGRGMKPGADNAFDARQVLDNLAASVVMPEQKGL